MKASGDIESLRKCLQSEKDSNGDEKVQLTCEWNYIEDMALSMPETSQEYRDLLHKKGRDEIERRKIFLLGAQGNLAVKE